MAPKDNNTKFNWMTKLSIPKLGGPDPSQKATLEQLQKEVQQLRKAMRWSMGFIINVALGMEVAEGAKVEKGRIKQGIKEGLKKGQVPRGVLSRLDDVPAFLKEWDFKTFRVEQDTQVHEKNAEQIVLRHEGCPEIFSTMRQSTQFLIDRVNMDYYVYLPSAVDFLCVPHTLCRSVLIDWLSDGKFQVEELGCRREGGRSGMCMFAVKPAVALLRRSADASRSPSQR